MGRSVISYRVEISSDDYQKSNISNRSLDSQLTSILVSGEDPARLVVLATVTKCDTVGIFRLTSIRIVKESQLFRTYISKDVVLREVTNIFLGTGR